MSLTPKGAVNAVLDLISSGPALPQGEDLSCESISGSTLTQEFRTFGPSGSALPLDGIMAELGVVPKAAVAVGQARDLEPLGPREHARKLFNAVLKLFDPSSTPEERVVVAAQLRREIRELSEAERAERLRILE